ncbi:hypothetical protein DRI50_07775 [candidate division KSB1 bacterium]|nr:MAG: hypothetical protein DRI50_07775 [candidate division KSB1 bacterium]
MKKLHFLLASLTLIAFLSAGLLQPVFAQHKTPKQGTERMTMMQHPENQPLQTQAKIGGMQGKMMGMGQMGSDMMQMKKDPVISALHHYGCPAFLLKNATQFNLSNQQKQTLNALKLEFKKSAIKTQADIKVAKLDIKEAMNADKSDFKKVKAGINAINTLQQKLRANFLNTFLKARKVLNNDQLKTLKALAANCCQRMPGKGMMHHQMMK